MTDDPANDHLSMWALGGERLLFWSERGLSGGETELFAADPDGSGQSRLASFNECWPEC